jgi:3'(2'), 5'-bisphosphate nucleotidase
VIDKLMNISLEAGEEILSIYNQLNVGLEYKLDGSPLSMADLRSNTIIISQLKKYFPSIPIISEENKSIAFELRQNWDRFFLIDPLDGTKEFLRKNGEFTVNIAYLENGIPLRGVVFAPCLNRMYCGSPEHGFQIFELNQFREFEEHQLNESEEITRSFRIVASRSHNNEKTEAFISQMRQEYGDVEIVSMGSSLKICLVAEGKAEVYPRLGPTMEWDTAAAHAILNYANCEIINYETQLPLVYNKVDLINPHFLVKRKS